MICHPTNHTPIMQDPHIQHRYPPRQQILDVRARTGYDTSLIDRRLARPRAKNLAGLICTPTRLARTTTQSSRPGRLTTLSLLSCIGRRAVGSCDNPRRENRRGELGVSRRAIERVTRSLNPSAPVPGRHHSSQIDHHPRAGPNPRSIGHLSRTT